MRAYRVLVMGVMLLSTLSSNAVPQPRAQLNRSGRVKAPVWFDKMPVDDSSVVARGRGESKDRQVALDKAVADARSTLAAMVEVRWKDLLTAIRKEGVAPPTVADKSVTLMGSKSTMQKSVKRGKIWTAFVLVAIPRSSVSTEIVMRLHHDLDWYAKAKGTRAVRELEGAESQR
jgi:hypothetical protein